MGSSHPPVSKTGWPRSMTANMTCSSQRRSSSRALIFRRLIPSWSTGRICLASLSFISCAVGSDAPRSAPMRSSVPQNRTLTVQAERRLKVMQSLDKLGAGFELASHDLDIRGAGNLLGEEQSGHIKEVGYEL